MAIDADSVAAVAFDSYGTLVDVTAVEDALAEHVDAPGVVAKLWRDRSLSYAMVANAIEEYDSFYAMNRRALEYAVETRGVELDEDAREEVLSTYHELPVFDDVRDGMKRLRDAGYDCYVVSNGSQEMLDSMVNSGGLGDLIAGTVSADEVEQFKPEAELYRHAADSIGAPAAEICFASAHWWDVPGAMHADMQGTWVDREDGRWGPYDAEPDLTVESFGELADELGA